MYPYCPSPRSFHPPTATPSVFFHRRLWLWLDISLAYECKVSLLPVRTFTPLPSVHITQCKVLCLPLKLPWPPKCIASPFVAMSRNHGQFAALSPSLAVWCHSACVIGTFLHCLARHLSTTGSKPGVNTGSTHAISLHLPGPNVRTPLTAAFEVFAAGLTPCRLDNLKIDPSQRYNMAH